MGSGLSTKTYYCALGDRVAGLRFAVAASTCVSRSKSSSLLQAVLPISPVYIGMRVRQDSTSLFYWSAWQMTMFHPTSFAFPVIAAYQVISTSFHKKFADSQFSIQDRLHHQQQMEDKVKSEVATITSNVSNSLTPQSGKLIFWLDLCNVPTWILTML